MKIPPGFEKNINNKVNNSNTTNNNKKNINANNSKTGKFKIIIKNIYINLFFTSIDY